MASAGDIGHGDRTKPPQPGAASYDQSDTMRDEAHQLLSGKHKKTDHPAHSSDTQSSTVSGAAEAASCPNGQEYKTIIDLAARQMYDFKSLGNWKQLSTQYDCKINEDPISVANRTLLKHSGDKYNYAMDKSGYAEIQSEISGTFSGIGANLGWYNLDANGKLIIPPHSDNPYHGKIDPKNSRVAISDVTFGTPAQAADLRPGDIITAVNGQDTTKMDSDDVTDLIRGPAGTPLKLTVLRDGQPITKDLTRQIINVHTVDDPQDRDGITYIRIRSFDENTPDELEAAMKAFPKTKGFVIDVRDNPGGLISGSTRSAEMFIRNGSIFTEVDRDEGDPRRAVYETTALRVTKDKEYTKWHSSTNPKHIVESSATRSPYLAGGKPVVLLTNGNTASAAEIFTGALGDNGVVVVGSGGDPTQKGNIGTFGKGIGQQTDQDLPDGGATKFTMLHYTTPHGTWPGDAAKHRIGLRPDIIVNNPDGVEPGAADDAQLNAGLAEIESQLHGTKHKTVLQ